ncbi:hypothetical protein AC1031_000119 [Aphanomyces cochlioides]|nr:hypothetical protein AC1031_000119 [Aphanomyces cochlioides]
MKERNDIGNIREVEQLKSRWRRLNEDYIDYHWLTNELDKTGRKHKLSRFRFEDFPYYDIMQSIVGDTMATGEFIRGSQDIRTSSLVARVFPTIEQADDERFDCDHDDQLPNMEKTSANDVEKPLSAAQRRAEMIDEAMKKNRKRKALDDQVKLELRKQNSKSLADLAKSVKLMAHAFAAKYNANIDDSDEE